MATYTSTQAGDWNDPATWGGGGYPSAAGDLAVIGHAVNYNVSHAFVDIDGMTKANPGVVSQTAHGFLSDDIIQFRGITQDPTLSTQWVAMNNQGYIVVKIDNNSYSLKTLAGVAVDTSTFTNALAAGDPGQVRKLIPLGTGTSDAITINSGGVLSFDKTMNTDLTLAHNDIKTNNGGEFRVGSSGGNKIPKQFLAEVMFINTADNAKGLNFADGGKFTAYGDPSYFGSDYHSVLKYGDIGGLTSTSPVTVTWTGHGLSNGDYVSFANIAQADWSTLNQVAFQITWVSADTFTIVKNAAAYAAYNTADPGLVGYAAVIPAAGNSVTLRIAGDFTTKWIAGQELLVHKGGNYANVSNDFCRLAITSVAANGSNTDVACTVTERPAASLTCLVSADVLNVSRNVMFYKLGYNPNLGQIQTIRPRLANANAAGTSNMNIHDVMFGGWYTAISGNNVIFEGVIRNGFRNGGTLCTITGIIMAHSDAFYGLINSSFNGYIVNGGTIQGGREGSVSGNIYGCNTALNAPMNHIYANVYSCSVGLASGDGAIMTGNLGFNGAGIAMANATTLNFGGGGVSNASPIPDAILINSKTPSTLVITNRNNLIYVGRYRFEHYQQVANTHYICNAYGDVFKVPTGGVGPDGVNDNPTQRSGGNADVIKACNIQTNCSASNYLELFNIRLWAEASVSKTYRFYVQTTYATGSPPLPTASFKLYGEYLDQGSGGRLATVSSTQDIATRANAADWTQYVEVTINPAQTGYINLYLRLMEYESGNKVWIDPMVAITGGNAVTVTPRWSYGEVQLDIDPVGGGGGGGLLTHPGMRGGLNG
jgi:hypothetical protein